MDIIMRLTAVGALSLIVGCTPPGVGTPTTVSGKITLNAATQPKLAVISFGGDNDEAALAELNSKVAAATEDKPLSITSVVKAQTNGSYTMQLSGTKPVTVFYVMAWDDKNNNDKIDSGEPLAKTSDGHDVYMFYKSAKETQEVKMDESVATLKTSYDWTFTAQ